MSATPEGAGSKGWDGACERVATWAILKDLESSKQLFVINTHLDHVRKVARQEGVTLEKRKYIDYIFVSQRIVVDEFQIIPSKLNDIYLSDHRPIVAKLTVK